MQNLQNMPALQLKLDASELERLRYERYVYPQVMVQKRLHAVYFKATTKLSYAAIGLLTGLHANSVASWVKAYQEHGYDALLCNGYGTTKSSLEQYSTSILEHFAKRPPHSAKEAKARIEELCGLVRSEQQIRGFMHRHGLHFIKMGPVPAKCDTEVQQAWVAEQLQPCIRAAEKGKVHLLFVDAAHFMLQPFLCCVWCVARLFLRAASGRNRINVLGAVDAISKKVVTMTNTTYINADVLISFLRLLKQSFRTKPLVIVLDNVRYQHCRGVEQAAASLGIRLLFLPPYSPNLNIIERLWRFAKKQILYGRYYDGADKFHLAVTSFFEQINKKHNKALHTLLTLKFQFFNLKNSQICPL